MKLIILSLLICLTAGIRIRGKSVAYNSNRERATRTTGIRGDVEAPLVARGRTTEQESRLQMQFLNAVRHSTAGRNHVDRVVEHVRNERTYPSPIEPNRAISGQDTERFEVRVGQEVTEEEALAMFEGPSRPPGGFRAGQILYVEVHSTLLPTRYTLGTNTEERNRHLALLVSY